MTWITLVMTDIQPDRQTYKQTGRHIDDLELGHVTREDKVKYSLVMSP